MSPTKEVIDPSRDPANDLDRGPAGDPAANATDPARRGTVPPSSIGRTGARHRRAVGWRSRDVVRAAALVLAMYLGVRLLWVAYALFLILFLGILFAIAVSAGVDRLQRARVPRGVGAALVVIAFFGLLSAFGAWIAPTLHSQGKELRQKLPVAVDRAQTWVEKRQNGIFGVLLGEDSTVTAVSDSVRAAPPAAGETVRAVPPTTTRGRLAGHMPSITKYLFPFLSTTAETVAGLLVIVFLSIYLATDPDLYRRGALALLPARKRKIGSDVLDHVAIVLRKWLVTQLIAMVVMGVVTTIALLLLHVKAAVALGILAGLFEFIPTVGPILSSVPAIAMAFLDSPEKALIVVGVYVGLHFLESHIMVPLLMKGGMNLPPALTVLTQALFALVFGFLGLMVAVPMLATVMVLVQMLYVEREPADGSASARGGREFDPDLDEPLSDGMARTG